MIPWKTLPPPPSRHEHVCHSASEHFATGVPQVGSIKLQSLGEGMSGHHPRLMNASVTYPSRPHARPTAMAFGAPYACVLLIYRIGEGAHETGA